MRPIISALLASTAFVPVANAASVDLIGTFNVAGFTLSPEETPEQASDWTGGNADPFDNDFSGGFMSPADDSRYADEAAEPELREQFNSALPYGGAQWVGNDATNAGVPIYADSTYGGAPVGDFVNKWVLPESAWEFEQITARFVLDSDDFTLGNVSSNINNDLIDDDFRLLSAELNTLFETNDLGAVFTTDTGASLNLSTTAAVALNATGSGDQTEDILIIAAIDDSLSGPIDPATGDNQAEGVFGIAFIGADNWFESVLLDENGDDSGGNLLDSLTDASLGLTTQFFIEERLWGSSDGQNFTPIGTFEAQASLDTLTTETSGSSERSALLPDAPADGAPADDGFSFEVEISELVNENGILWIDPDIATGYVYQATRVVEKDGLGEVTENVGITAVQAPGLGFVNDPDGYTLTVTHIIDTAGDLVALPEDSRPSYTILPGEIVSFTNDTPNGAASPFAQRVGIFELTGISEDLMLDPENGLVFQTGLGFDETQGLFTISQTPITTYVPDDVNMTPVPLPLPALMLITGLGGLAALRRRKKA